MIVLILYIPVNNFSVMLGWVFLVRTSAKQRIKCIAQGHNAQAFKLSLMKKKKKSRNDF